VSGPFPVRIVNSAARAIVEAAEWWIAHRTKAPDAFAVELERALQLLASQPSIGKTKAMSGTPGFNIGSLCHFITARPYG
jgi:hypothetical protein